MALIGQLLINLAINSSAFAAGTANVRSELTGLQEAAEKTHEVLARVAEIAGVGAGIEGIKSITSGSIEAGAALERLGESLKIPVEQLSALQGDALVKANLTGGDFTLMLNRMAKNLGDATHEGGENAKMLASLGLNARQLANQSLDKTFLQISDAIAKMPQPTDQAAAAVALFGRQGFQLLPMLREGAAGLAEFKKEMAGTGAIWTQQDIDTDHRAEEQLNRLGLVLKGLGNQITVDLAPAIESVTRNLTAGLPKIEEWISVNTRLIEILAALGVGYRVLTVGWATSVGFMSTFNAGLAAQAAAEAKVTAAETRMAEAHAAAETTFMRLQEAQAAAAEAGEELTIINGRLAEATIEVGRENLVTAAAVSAYADAERAAAAAATEAAAAHAAAIVAMGKAAAALAATTAAAEAGTSIWFRAGRAVASFGPKLIPLAGAVTTFAWLVKGTKEWGDEILHVVGELGLLNLLLSDTHAQSQHDLMAALAERADAFNRVQESAGAVAGAGDTQSKITALNQEIDARQKLADQQLAVMAAQNAAGVAPENRSYNANIQAIKEEQARLAELQKQITAGGDGGGGASKTDKAAEAAIRQQEEHANRVKEILADLQKQLDTFGMSEGDKLIYDLKHNPAATPADIDIAQSKADRKDQLETMKKLNDEWREASQLLKEHGDRLGDAQSAVEKLSEVVAGYRKMLDDSAHQKMPAVDILNWLTAAQKALAAAQTDLKNIVPQADKDAARSMWESALTPLQRYQDAVGEVNKLFREGLLTAQQQQQVIAHLGDALDKADKTKDKIHEDDRIAPNTSTQRRYDFNVPAGGGQSGGHLEKISSATERTAKASEQTDANTDRMQRDIQTLVMNGSSIAVVSIDDLA